MAKPYYAVVALIALIVDPALAESGCCTAACNQVIQQINHFSAADPYVSTTGNMTSSTRIQCEKRWWQQLKATSGEYRKNWQALFYAVPRSAGMTAAIAKAQTIQTYNYDKSWAALEQKASFCETKLLNTKEVAPQ